MMSIATLRNRVEVALLIQQYLSKIGQATLSENSFKNERNEKNSIRIFLHRDRLREAITKAKAPSELFFRWPQGIQKASLD